MSDGLGEWVKVYDNYIDRCDIVLLYDIVILIVMIEDVVVYFWMQGFYVFIYYFWEIGVVRDFGNWQVFICQQVSGVVGGQQFDIMSGKCLCEFDDIGFVRNIEQSVVDWMMLLYGIKFSGFEYYRECQVSFCLKIYLMYLIGYLCYSVVL